MKESNSELYWTVTSCISWILIDENTLSPSKAESSAWGVSEQSSYLFLHAIYICLDSLTTSWNLYKDTNNKFQNLPSTLRHHTHLPAQTRLLKIKHHIIFNIQAQVVHQLKLMSFMWCMPQWPEAALKICVQGSHRLFIETSQIKK